METYFGQLKEYLKMDTEIPYEEFERYYQEFINFLNDKFQDLNQEELLKGRYISSILQTNSWERSKRKNSYAKKYKKIADKTHFWSDAINHRLLKEGMTQAEIDQSDEEFGNSI